MERPFYIVQGCKNGKRFEPKAFQCKHLVLEHAKRLRGPPDKSIAWLHRFDAESNFSTREELNMTPGNSADRELAERGKDQAKKKQDHAASSDHDAEKKKGGGTKAPKKDQSGGEDSGATPGNKTRGDKGGSDSA